MREPIGVWTINAREMSVEYALELRLKILSDDILLG